MYTDKVKRGVTSVVLCILFLSIVLTLFLSCAQPIHAFGISAPYFEDDTMRVEPGKDYEYNLSMQNGDETDYDVIVEYSSTKDVAILDKTVYIVPSKTYDTAFSFKIHIPQDATIGDIYTLEYSAKPTINSTGGVSLGLEIRRSIRMRVVDASAPESTQAETPSNTDLDSGAEGDDAKSGLTYAGVSRFMSGIGKYLLFALLLIAAIFITIRIWKISRSISAKISDPNKAIQPISQATTLREVADLLERIGDDEFEVPDIKDLFRNKISELTDGKLALDLVYLTRKDTISIVERLR